MLNTILCINADKVVKQNKGGWANFVTYFSEYCNRRNFHTRFNFILFVLSAESTKFSSIRKPCTYDSACDTILAVRKFIPHENSRRLEYKIFTRRSTKISAITVHCHDLMPEAAGRWLISVSLLLCDLYGKHRFSGNLDRYREPGTSRQAEVILFILDPDLECHLLTFNRPLVVFCRILSTAGE